jgi:hypothetical protein
LRGGGSVVSGGIHGSCEFTGEGGEAAAYASVELFEVGEVGFNGGEHAPWGRFGVGGGADGVDVDD